MKLDVANLKKEEEKKIRLTFVMSDPAGSLRFNPSSAGALTLGVNMSVTFSENTNLNINQSIIQ